MESIQIELGADISDSNAVQEACADVFCNQFGAYFAKEWLSEEGLATLLVNTSTQGKPNDDSDDDPDCTDVGPDIDEDELKALRQKRLQAMKKAQEEKEGWLANGHGKYEEIPDEATFFAECKKAKNLVVHFYREATFRCKIVDKHLQILAAKHLEAKFLKIDAEKSPFLIRRLKIRVLPTICLVLLSCLSFV